MQANEGDKSTTIELTHAKFIIDQFISSCSHDLKSPLTSIEGLLMIAEHYPNHDEVNQCLGLINGCVSNMKEMILKLEEYTLSLQRELNHDDIKADQLVEKVLSEYDKEIEKQQIEVSAEISQPNKWIADRHCYYLIFKNLISNAIHFSDPDKKKKRVKIKVSVNPDHVDVEVSDNGIGIPEKEKEKVFKPFHRSSSQSKGTGLGLFLVKGILDKLGASISMYSNENVGTSFQLSIPNHQML